MNESWQHNTPDDPEEPVDNHSGSRLVLLLFLFALAPVAGLLGWQVSHELVSPHVGHDTSIRLQYVVAGLAMGGTILLFLRWQQMLTRKAQFFSQVDDADLAEHEALYGSDHDLGDADSTDDDNYLDRDDDNDLGYDGSRSRRPR